jgi:hypothetical protein
LKDNVVHSSYDKNDIETAETMKEFAFAAIGDSIHLAVDKSDDYNEENFKKFEYEYNRRKMIHEAYVKRKEQEDIKSKIEHHERLEKDKKKDGWHYSDSSESEDDVDVDKFPGEISPFSFLMEKVPYDFQQYIPLNPDETQRKRDKNTVLISDQHVPVGKGIADKYVAARLAFKNEKGKPGDVIWTVRIIYHFIFIFYIIVIFEYNLKKWYSLSIQIQRKLKMN